MAGLRLKSPPPCSPEFAEVDRRPTNRTGSTWPRASIRSATAASSSAALAWDMIGTEFAGRHQQYELFYAGAPFVTRNYSFMNYDFGEALDLVDRCLGEYE
ncbi:MAG: 4-hydroxyphenylacetate 3-hydroxylase C-terminal domain-containing protein [Planctomycetaceae bacterium]